MRQPALRRPGETSPASASLAAATHPAWCKCEWGAVPALTRLLTNAEVSA